MKRRLAIIPARGGSKRIPGKNIKIFHGKPIIKYTIDAANKSGLFDKIHISTDDENIKKVVENGEDYFIDFLRPKNLSDDFTPLMPVLKYVVEKYENEFSLKFDEVWLLMACAPLLTPGELILASNYFNNMGSDKSMSAVAELPVPYEWIFQMTSEMKLEPIVKGGFANRSQDLAKIYFDCGVFYAYDIEVIKNSDGAGSDLNQIGFIYPKGKAIDIDDQEDWEVAEKLYSIYFN